jgi:hypothetical protein
VEVERLIKQRLLEPECERKEDWRALADEFKRCNIKTLNRLGYTALILVHFHICKELGFSNQNLQFYLQEFAVLACALLVAFIVKRYYFESV